MLLNSRQIRSLKWVKVSSSNLREIYYDKANRVLYIKFNNSSEIYYYNQVLPPIFDGLQKARSKGTYFNERIRYKHSYGTI